MDKRTFDSQFTNVSTSNLQMVFILNNIYGSFNSVSVGLITNTLTSTPMFLLYKNAKYSTNVNPQPLL